MWYFCWEVRSLIAGGLHTSMHFSPRSCIRDLIIILRRYSLISRTRMTLGHWLIWLWSHSVDSTTPLLQSSTTAITVNTMILVTSISVCSLTNFCYGSQAYIPTLQVYKQRLRTTSMHGMGGQRGNMQVVPAIHWLHSNTKITGLSDMFSNTQLTSDWLVSTFPLE